MFISIFKILINIYKEGLKIFIPTIKKGKILTALHNCQKKNCQKKIFWQFFGIENIY